MNRKNIIFDFDGVIVDSFDIAFETNKLARPTLTRERYRAKFNGNINDAKHEDEKVNDIDFFYEFGEKFKHLGIKSDIKNNIKKLSEENNLFIVSSTPNPIISDYLQRHSLLGAFTELYGLDVHKSKVLKFNMIFEKYKISPNQTIFVTDTSGDVIEAKEVKIDFIIGILGGYQDEESLQKANPDMIVKDFNNLIEVIESKNMS